ncbi:MAG: hypothetical protein O2816_00480 [Planctomycetota bacterium]|nr:hypothetical protein [Planctomycetota bacterium]
MITPTLLLLACAVPGDKELQPLDFAKVSRALTREPAYVAAPRYGMFLFGVRGEQRMWAVLDKTQARATAYDVLYLDLDADGVLGEAGERFAATEAGEGRKFTIGDLHQPGSKAVHTQFELTWTPESVRYSMLWKGEELSRGGYGPTRDTYASFGESAEAATIYVPGYDRPLEFEHWMSGTLLPRQTNTFKVFVGQRGSQRGAFSCGDEDFLPEGEHVLATLIYRDADGQEQRHVTKLQHRC